MSASERAPRRATPPGGLLALGIFALMALAGPLLFGAVDRLQQIGLLALLAIGILAQPPVVEPLSRWGNRLAIAFVGLIIFAQFAPANWFGETIWRTALTREFSLGLPGTHHPEPGRAIEGLLAGTVGVVWFWWVRRLAAESRHRPLLAWILLIAAALVAAVSFATRSSGSEAIYGLRFTPGWSGFGPFPNRNHSADFFAMAAVLGCGCLTWAALRKRWWLLAAGVGLVVLIVIALLATESRGGLLAFAAGLGAYLALGLLKFRNRRALGAALSAALIFGTLALVFGARVFSRFESAEAGAVSTFTRLHVWQDALAMWRDAPLLGHGVGAFASVFPFYQTIELENQIVIHPESSWLQWLTEWGALPVLLAVVGLAIFLRDPLRESFTRRRGFFLRAGGFSAFAVLLAHALVDVPAHRWGTAGFALAALAIACPMHLRAGRGTEARRTAFVPLAVAGFWILPLVWDIPRWSPTALTRLLSRQAVPPGVPASEILASVGWFPLNAELHQSAGFRLLGLHGRAGAAEWQRHFAMAARLAPGSWYLTVAQARSVQQYSPMMALPYWQQSVARGGIHRDEILADGLRETGAAPAARAAWGRYAEAHPHLLLAFARVVPETQAGYYFGRWWKQRALTAELSEEEMRDFYALSARHGNRAQLDAWMARYAARQPRDFRAWAALLHHWADDARAWELLAAHIAEPAFPTRLPTTPLAQLDATWHAAPLNLVNAQQLAQLRDATGDAAGRDEILLAVGAEENAPPWFLERAAHVLARQGRLREAVALLLRTG